jgi:cell wall-associated NlpC family hydrolase
MGIDCSGLILNVMKIKGIALPRDASQQVKLGHTVGFIGEAERGDFCFFDNSEGRITHVGIYMGNKEIIHASGKVRIDAIDHQGIYNRDTKKYTHRLRIIKRLK